MVNELTPYIRYEKSLLGRAKKHFSQPIEPDRCSSQMRFKHTVGEKVNHKWNSRTLEIGFKQARRDRCKQVRSNQISDVLGKFNRGKYS
jgi:hypothetical protein